MSHFQDNSFKQDVIEEIMYIATKHKISGQELVTDLLSVMMMIISDEFFNLSRDTKAYEKGKLDGRKEILEKLKNL